MPGTLDAAYAAEAEYRRGRIAAGHKVVGRKVGYANKAMWRVLKLETLVWASMYDDTVHTGPGFRLQDTMAPKIEPEIVFKLNQSMHAESLDAAAALAAVEWFAIGFEIIDYSCPDWKFTPADFVAAGGLHRALVVGQPTYVDTASIPALVAELATFKLKLLKNGDLAEEGSGKNCLRSPALCLAELASAVRRQPGATPLEAGELISTGTLTAAPFIAPGEQWKAEVEGLSVSGITLDLI
jgi:2-keto-4-pentenoate hydratase